MNFGHARNAAVLGFAALTTSFAVAQDFPPEPFQPKVTEGIILRRTSIDKIDLVIATKSEKYDYFEQLDKQELEFKVIDAIEGGNKPAAFKAAALYDKITAVENKPQDKLQFTDPFDAKEALEKHWVPSKQLVTLYGPNWLQEYNDWNKTVDQIRKNWDATHPEKKARREAFLKELKINDAVDDPPAGLYNNPPVTPEMEKRFAIVDRVENVGKTHGSMMAFVKREFSGKAPVNAPKATP